MRLHMSFPIVLVLTFNTAHADDLWLQASGAKSTVSSQQFVLTRTFNNADAVDFEAGLSHFNSAGAGWTLAKFGMNGRVGEKFILSGNLEVGPGRSNGEDISYHKATLAGTWLLSPQWSAELRDTYINIDDSLGHVFSTSISRSFKNGLGITLDNIGSGGGNIDTHQVGAKFRWQAKTPVFGGVYAGETRNPIILNEVGTVSGSDPLQLREAYVGVEFAVGTYSLMAIFDYLKLDQTSRRELTFVLKIPLGAGNEDVR